MGAHKPKPIGKLVRKNLILDDAAVRLLAEQRGTSESEAVRQVVAEALRFEEMADQMMDALGKLRKRGTLVKNLELMFPQFREFSDEELAKKGMKEIADAAP